ncbi:MAG: hypothetical protein EON88_36810, partial [Brevundimonas sp.]
MRLLLAACAVLALTACGPSSDPAETETAVDDVAAPVMPTDAPPQEEAPPEVTPAGSDALSAADRTCRDSIGEAASAKLVERCIAVSPATH